MTDSARIYTGEYKHSIDAKKRMFLPAAFREALGEDIVMTKGVDTCVSVYPLSSWNAFTEKLNALPEIQARRIKRFIYASAQKTQLDSQGRVLLPQNLREYAGLDKNAYVIGVGDHVEIWDETQWDTENGKMDSDEVVETLVALGF